VRPDAEESLGASNGRARPPHRRSLAARAAIALAALAVAVVLFVLLARGGDDATPATAQPQSVEDATGGQSPAPPAATKETKARPEAKTPRAPTVERIVVRGGKPVGGVKRLEYERGEQVRFTVRSDVADEVHVHGFDISRDVRANGTVRFGFPADIEGVFEVELESAHLTIAKLRIRP
jgi:hypothetical protein